MLANTSMLLWAFLTECFYTRSNYSKANVLEITTLVQSPTQGDITAFVVDDPDAVFLMDADAAFTRADLFQNYSVTTLQV